MATEPIARISYVTGKSASVVYNSGYNTVLVKKAVNASEARKLPPLNVGSILDASEGTHVTIEFIIGGRITVMPKTAIVITGERTAKATHVNWSKLLSDIAKIAKPKGYYMGPETILGDLFYALFSGHSVFEEMHNDYLEHVRNIEKDPDYYQHRGDPNIIGIHG